MSSTARIAIILCGGLGMVPIVARSAGCPPDEILFLTGGYAVVAVALCFIVPIMSAPHAIVLIGAAVEHIRRGKDYDRRALRRACWTFRGNPDVRELVELPPAVAVPDDLLRRLEQSLPRLEVSVNRRYRVLYLIMIACLAAGAVCRFIGRWTGK